MGHRRAVSIRRIWSVVEGVGLAHDDHLATRQSEIVGVTPPTRRVTPLPPPPDRLEGRAEQFSDFPVDNSTLEGEGEPEARRKLPAFVGSGYVSQQTGKPSVAQQDRPDHCGGQRGGRVAGSVSGEDPVALRQVRLGLSGIRDEQARIKPSVYRRDMALQPSGRRLRASALLPQEAALYRCAGRGSATCLWCRRCGPGRTCARATCRAGETETQLRKASEGVRRRRGSWTGRRSGNCYAVGRLRVFAWSLA